MNNNLLSPYIRTATFHSFPKKFRLAKRIIFDYELIYALDGGARVLIGGEEYICRRNEVIFLRPGISHELIYLDDLVFTQPHIHFDMVYNTNSERTPICFKDKNNLSEYEFTLIQDDILGENIPYVFMPCKSEEFRELFFDILTLYKNRPQRFELSMKIKMLELLSLIFEQFDIKAAPPANTVNEPAVIVKNYIDNNFLRPLTLEGLQEQFYINKYTLIRNFNRLYKKSPIAYYHERRLEYSKEMLASTDNSISSISAKMNFPDSYSFNRFFRTHMKMSPTEYRTKARKNKT